jgi:hypothetical protein
LEQVAAYLILIGSQRANTQRTTRMRKVINKLQDYAVFVFAFLPVMIAASVAEAATQVPLF